MYNKKFMKYELVSLVKGPILKDDTIDVFFLMIGMTKFMLSLYVARAL